MKNNKLRLIFTILVLLIQAAFIGFSAVLLSKLYAAIYFLLLLTAFVAVIWINSQKINSSFKAAWITVFFAAPMVTPVLFVIYRLNSLRYHKRNKCLSKINTGIQLHDEIPSKTAKQLRYISYAAKSYPSNNTKTEFFSCGEEFIKRYIEVLENAKQSIYIEYFIVSDGILWETLSNILISKAENGVDIKILYDDMGTIKLLKNNFADKLTASGIKLMVFNRFSPVINEISNNRDHRKLTIIDGIYAFTGGMNLSDEYVNITEPHGYWKDYSILLSGDSVEYFTKSFLDLWDYSRNKASVCKYTEHHSEIINKDNIVIPFCDGPFNEFSISEDIYLNMISSAEYEVSITTPYLIPDYETISTLRRTSMSGVKVQIFTPHIPDKWYVHAVTRSNYNELIEAGIDIYEYLPGFVHAKSIVCDNNSAIIATANFDYRSFYMHFENGVFMNNCEVVDEILADHEEIKRNSVRISKEDCEIHNPLKKLGINILRLFAPLM